jgi:hypothetical protein
MRASRLVEAAIVVGAALVPTTAAAQRGDSPTAPTATAEQIAFGFAGRYDTGLPDTSAETVSIAGNRMDLSNANDGPLDVVDISNPATPTLLQRVDVKALAGFGDGASISSVATSGDVVAVAVIADPKTEPGAVLVLKSSAAVLGRATVGSNPDALAFTPDGKRIAGPVQFSRLKRASHAGDRKCSAGAMGTPPSATWAFSIWLDALSNATTARH